MVVMESWIAIVSTILMGGLLWYCYKRLKEKVSENPTQQTISTEGSTHQFLSGRMRKRDIVRYYGRRMIRKAGMELRHLRKRPRERVFSIAKRFLQGPEIPERQLYREPPEAFLEADYMEGDHNIPPDVLYLLKSVRAFGHFEKPLFMELCKHVQTKFVPAGEVLFKPGFKDDSIYVVRNGLLKVCIIQQDGVELPLKEAGPGDSVHSMLSILDTITGHPKPFKTVAARALRDSYVLQVNGIAFKNFFEENPDSLLRMVQIIMVRLQRVTFLALNQFLGLGHELLNQQKPTHLDEYCVCKLQQNRSIQPPTQPQAFGQAEVHDSDSDNCLSNSLYSLQNDLESSDVSKCAKNDSAANVVRSTDSDVQSEELSPLTKHKIVAIDTSRNKHFTQRLLPVQSPEFDNVIDQARIDRQKFSTEGLEPCTPAATGTGEGRSSVHSHVENSEVVKAATADLLKILQLEDEIKLKGRFQLIEVPADSLLGLEGDKESCIYFIATGKLRIYKHGSKLKSTVLQDLLYVAYPGEFCGVLSALTGEPSFISISAAVHSQLIAITKTNLYHIMSEHPKAICGIAYDLVQRLSPIVRQMDFALDWMELEAGRALYRQGDEAEAAYIILNGRVRSVVRTSKGKKELVDEYGRGETIGLVEVTTSSTCATTVHAIRDTELACLPSGLLNTIKLKQPQVVSRLIQVLGERILGSYNRFTTPESSPIASGVHMAGPPDAKKHMVSNLSTVAVVPITRDIPLNNFTKNLCVAVNTIAPALRLTSQLVQEELGSAALESVHEYRLRTWLGHQEDNHRIVLYQADADVSPWTARCIRQADCILLVGLAEKTPSESMSHIVKQVESISVRVQKELVLLHREGVLHPTGTVKWLNALGWLSSYFHVRCPDSYFSSKDIVVTEVDKHSDCARLARQLTGTSVGLVLGGGGARGIAHIGAIRALAEAGVPVDIIAGTSIGSFVGALYCEERDADKVERRSREWSKSMASISNKIFDLTYPTTSMFTGQAFNGLIHKVFGEKQIEDLWIPYLCITTDITESKMRVHSSGSLWRYVRASMSLSGYLPPLCDPVDGHLLLDGGYVNNLPGKFSSEHSKSGADVISSYGAETVIAIDVGSQDNNDLTNYGDHLSGWYLLWNKLNPFAKKIRVPSLTEIQSRLAYVSCIRQLEAVKTNGMCEYIRPPIDNIGTLQFGSFEKIVVRTSFLSYVGGLLDNVYPTDSHLVEPLGYEHCRGIIDGWQRDRKMHHILSAQNEDCKRQHTLDKLTKQNSNSVRDLVALAAQIFRPPPENDDPGVQGYWSNPEDQIYSNQSNSDQGKSSEAMAMFTFSDSELT